MGNDFILPVSVGYKEMVVGTVSAGIQGILLSPKMQKPVDIYNKDTLKTAN